MKETNNFLLDLGYTKQEIEDLTNKKEKLKEEQNIYYEEFEEWKFIETIPYKRLLLAIHYSKNKKKYRIRLIDYNNVLQDYTKYFKNKETMESYLKIIEKENCYINEIDLVHNLQFENIKTREEERIEKCP